MKYLANCNLPVPEIYAWNSDTSNPVGAEYMIMQKVFFFFVRYLVLNSILTMLRGVLLTIYGLTSHSHGRRRLSPRLHVISLPPFNYGLTAQDPCIYRPQGIRISWVQSSLAHFLNSRTVSRCFPNRGRSGILGRFEGHLPKWLTGYHILSGLRFSRSMPNQGNQRIVHSTSILPL